MAFTLGSLFGTLDPSWKDEVLQDVAYQASELFKTYMATLEEAASLSKLKADERLEAYYQRTPEQWAGIQAQFPQEHERQLRDWSNLQNRASRRAATPAVAKEIAKEQPTPSLPALPGAY